MGRNLSPPAPEDRDICSGSFCTRNSSFKHDYRFYSSRGSETEQRSGGYQVSHHLCFKWGFIPWVCSASTRFNSLHISDVYFIGSPPFPPAPTWYRRMSATNVNDLTEKIWVIGFVPSMVRDISGVCGAHASSGTGGQVPDVITAAGYVSDCF